MTLYKEGQGNWDHRLGHPKAFTCGPAATRNMVAAMYKSHKGYYKDFGEHRFELWENTTRNGTSAENVKRTLNNHFSQFGSWSLRRPRNKDEYFAYVQMDTYWYRQSVIKNLDTEYLGYFNGKRLNHFNMDFGFKTRAGGGRKIRIAEEWNPKFIYGSTPWYGNPYGKHWVWLSQAYDSVKHTSYHYMVV